jgi:hypothetical protein
MDHRIDAKHLRSLEELGKFALPSSPAESLQAIILGKLPTIGFKKHSISVEFCELIISIWRSCIKEAFVSGCWCSSYSCSQYTSTDLYES